MSGLSRSLSTAILLGAGTIWGCSGSDDGPSGPEPDPNPDPGVGSIQVSTSTTGVDLDADGYTVSMAGSSDRSIGRNGVTTFADVTAGPHQVQLTGLANNCAVDGVNPATVSVTDGATTEVSFEVVCEALPLGSLEITTVVSNNFDPDGFQVFVAGTVRGRVEVGANTTLDDLPAGAHEVELREIAPNCSVDGANPATVTIPVGSSASHSFSIVCTNPPDGRIVYFEVSGSREGLTVMNADGSGRLLVFEGGPTRRLRKPRWSPDGSKIVFVMYDPTGLDDYREVFTINQDGSDLTQLTSDDGYADNPSWSPDGAQIAFDYSDECCGGTLHVVNSDGTGFAEIPRDGPMFREESPNWSPDGSQIVFFGMAENFLEPGIFVMDAGGGLAEQISADPPVCDATGEPSWFDGAWWGRPVWSPDGAKILFSRSYQCEPEASTNEVDLLVMSPDGTGVVNITNGPGWAVLPSWSPDGSKIVYDGADWSIHVINADGSGDTPIIPPRSSAVVEPDWGP